MPSLTKRISNDIEGGCVAAEESLQTFVVNKESNDPSQTECDDEHSEQERPVSFISKNDPQTKEGWDYTDDDGQTHVRRTNDRVTEIDGTQNDATRGNDGV
jgi:hypothetical protein